MSLILVNEKFECIPADMQGAFIHSVLKNYFDIAQFKRGNLVSELNIEGEMINVLSRVTSLQIFEDQYEYQKQSEDDEFTEMFEDLNGERYDHFMHDIVLVFENMKLSYFLDKEGTFHNMPSYEVW